MLLLCLCSVVKANFKGDDQLNERNQFILETYHEALEVVLDNNKIENYDSPYRFMELVPNTVSVASQSEVMKIENKFISQDFERASHLN